ncbi:retinitis pigmentosa 1-like 1 protein [Acanthochromis polyacanthus]|uniref:retinitis pigmentosa 1-like 1 protein n=1 Tax=Acanthochromis polyacanthus TaxID=80966 RepID=UPI002234373D|nr:retinitis pigmentosa 1-like 1 protein [Acanthochromis polyacanthus]XP_022051964.2 retinitis pigmentosa 1-like 1 protein [Acanthochromis polyacanthus]
MGNSCCRPESPCGSAEERSGLLTDDSKGRAGTGDTLVVGTCGPQGDDDTRKTPVEDVVQLKQSPENGETELNNTQENGPLPKESVQTATPSPRKVSELKENGTRAQDKEMKETAADSHQAELLQCTLNCPQEDLAAAASLEVRDASKAEEEEENPASEQDRILDDGTENTETNTTATEHITASGTHEDEEARARVAVDTEVAKPSEESAESNENVPKAQPAAAVGQESTVSNTESLSCAVAEDPDNSSSLVCREAAAEDTNIPDVSSSGPEPARLNHSGGERDSASSEKEPETTAPADASESLKSDQDPEPDPECATTSSKEVTSSEKLKQDAGKEVMLKVQEGHVPKVKEDEGIEEEEEEEESAPSEAGKDAEIQEEIGKEEEQQAENEATEIKVLPATEKEESLGNSEEDLYRGAEELSASQSNKTEAKFLKVEDRCSLAAAVDILSYSEREWKGNTAKSALIKKGYKEMSQRFRSLRRVRGDNYCALRATLFQVLSHSTQLPAWLQDDDITQLPEQLEAQEGLISQWTFPGECLQGDGTAAAQQLTGYMELLQNKWQAAVDCSSAAERQQLCERVFQGGEEELGLLEALKLLMLGRAVELHGCMQAGGDVPLFCWLLFARDSSDCPRSFLSNHLSHVGLSAGLEQVEMFLLGYALQCTIQVYRLYKADTEEFVTYYPDDHKDDWPFVCLVTEDDRHYNVPVVEAAELHKELTSS